MKILEIYKKYRVPKNLQRHMLLVASLGYYILRMTKEINSEKVIKALLLHDIANLIKFDLEKGLYLFDNSEQDITFWQKVQTQMVKKYGKDEHVATIKIVNEIGVSNEVVKLIRFIDSDNISTVLETDDFAIKIGVYCDFRATNDRYVTLIERFDDIIKRYTSRVGFMGKEKATKKKNDCIRLEKQIEERFQISLHNLDNLKLSKIYEKLQEYDI